MPVHVTCIPYNSFILPPSVLERMSGNNCLLVTPTHRILKPLARQSIFTTGDTSHLMPDVMLRSHFFKVAFPLEDSGFPASPYQELLCLYEALQNISSKNTYLERIRKKSFYDFIHFGRDILNTFHELIQAGKPIINQIEDIIEKVVHLRWADEKKFELLKELFPAWQRRMEKDSFTSILFSWNDFCRGTKPLDTSFLSKYSLVAFLDYKPLTPLEQAVLGSLKENSTPEIWSFFWQTGHTEFEKLKKYFSAPLFELRNQPPARTRRQNKISICRYSTPLNEIAAVKKKMECHLAGKADNNHPIQETLQKTAIITPDSEIVPSFLSFFPDGILNISVGLPLQKNPLFDLLKRWESLLTETVQSFDKKFFRLQHLLHFLFSPSIKRYISRKAAKPLEQINAFFQNVYLSTLDYKENLFFQNARELITGWKKYCREGESDEQVCQIIEELLNTFIFDYASESFNFSAGISQIRALLSPVLDFDYHEDIDERKDILRAESSLQKAWDIMEECRSDFTCSGIELLKIHNALLSGLSFSLPAPVHGISLMGYQEAALLDFSTVFLPDLSDKYPDRSSPSLFLNNQLRSQLGIPDQDYYYFTQKAAFEGIIARADRVCISFAQSQQSTIPSPFIHELRLEEEQLQITEDGREYSRDFLDIQTSVSISPPSREGPTFLSPWQDKATSVSKLLQYVRCPYQAYLEAKKLKKEPELQLDDTLNYAELGGIAHRIIHSILPAGINFSVAYPQYSAFEKALNAAIQNTMQRLPHSNLVPMNKMALKNLFMSSWKQFYRYQQERWKEYRIIDTEKPRRCTYLSRDIYFRLDRLDQNSATKKHVVIDYKTSRFTYDDFEKVLPTLKKNLNEMNSPDQEGLFIFSLKQHKGWDHFLEILFYGCLLSETQQIDIDGLILLYFTEQGFFEENIFPDKEKIYTNAQNILSAILSLQLNQDSPLGYLQYLDEPNDADQKKFFRIQAGTCRYCEYTIYCPFYADYYRELEKYMYRGNKT